MATGEFSVVTFFDDENYHYELRFVDAETAVKRAEGVTQSVGARVLNIVQRVIITDGGDNTAWEWIQGQGLVFPPPPPEEGK